MIYLIKSAGYKEEEEGKTSTFFLLKIGYTEDNRKEVRYSHYRLHNPTCQVLYEIPGATEDHEKRVQYKFRDLLFPDYGREWFEYSEEIIEFFKGIKSLEELENLPKGNTDRSKYLKYKKKVRKVLGYLTDIMQGTKEFRELCEEIYDILGDKITDEPYVMKYLESKFGKEKVEKYNKIQESLKTRKLCENDIINQEALEFLKEYNSLTEARKKLILLCESSLSGRLSKEAAEVVISQIPDSDYYIKGYYQSLGPEKLKRLGYIRANIERELGIVTFSGDILLESIYSEFKEGEKYSLSSLKNKLSLVYSSINYNSTPKANDIERYFEIKGVVAYEKDEKTGKRKQIRGYELVRSREQELRYELKLAE